MSRYLVVRAFEVTEDEMPEVGRRSRRIIEQEYPEIIWEHSHVVVDPRGKVVTYCIYAAPSEEIVRFHARDLGSHVIEAIHEIAGDVTPADFPG
jgi:Nickel responsive protein SCO4226-like